MKLSIRCTITTALLLLIALASFATAQPVQAEGSRNLTDNGGDRPWLQYSGDGTTTAGILRDNLLKVYVNEGDTIYLGSSAMGIGIGDILWTARDGTTGRCSVEGAGAGRILNRAEEVAGAAPLAAGGYTPCVVSVGAGQSGIWFVTFTAPNTGNNNPNAIEADAPWTQRADITSIAAWDISVANAAGEEIKGRAYASYLPLTLARPARSLYSQLYVLTRDGYMYDWDLNGIQPTTFILFSNKKGFKIAATDAPSYQSVSLLGGEFNNLLPMEFELNAPDDPDIGTDVTNKLFFNMPSPDLPSSANRPLEATWLLRDPVQPISIENLAFAGAQSGVGGTFTFDSNSDGAFQLIIDTSGDGLLSLEQDLVLYGDAVAGPNVVEWDGLDTEGQIADISVCSEVIARGVAGEAHFPIYDAEQNPNGMIFKRVNGAEAGQFTVYYNDSQLGGEMALDGEDAENGAHVWTVLNGGDPEGFGNQLGIDTWAYAIGENTDATVACDAASLDATKRDSHLIDIDGNGVVSPGDTLQYEVVIQHSGDAPAQDVTFDDTPDSNTTLVSGTVTTSQGTVTSGNSDGDLSVSVDIGVIPSGGSVTIGFNVTINDPFPAGVTQVANQGLINSPSISETVPTDDPDTPEIDDPTVTPVVTSPLLDATKADSLATDLNSDGFAGPGDVLLYEIVLQNSGNGTAVDVLFDDTPDSNTTLVSGSVTTSQGTVTTGNSSGDLTVAIAIGDMQPGAEVTITFQVTVNDPFPVGVTQVANQGLFNSSTISETVPTDDPDTPEVDDPTVTPIVIPSVTEPSLDATKTDSLFTDLDGDGIAGPGDVLLYEITLQNSGNGVAADVFFNDAPDSNTTLVAGSVISSQGTVTTGNIPGDVSVSIDLGDLLPGAEVTISFRVQINDPLPLDITQVANQGLIDSSTISDTVPTDDPDTPEEDDPTITPVGQYGLLIVKSAEPASGTTVMAGELITYHITLTNSGSFPLTGVVISDTIPVGVSYVPNSASPAPASGPDPLVWNVPALAVGESLSFSFVVRVDDKPTTPTIRNIALAESNQTPPKPSNEIEHPVTEPTGLPTTEQPERPIRLLLPFIAR